MLCLVCQRRVSPNLHRLPAAPGHQPAPRRGGGEGGQRQRQQRDRQRGAHRGESEGGLLHRQKKTQTESCVRGSRARGKRGGGAPPQNAGGAMIESARSELLEPRPAPSIIDRHSRPLPALPPGFFAPLAPPAPPFPYRHTPLERGHPPPTPPEIALRALLARAGSMAPLARPTRGVAAAALGGASRNKDWENPTVTQKNRCVGWEKGKGGRNGPRYRGRGGFWRVRPLSPPFSDAGAEPSTSDLPTPPHPQLPPPRPAALVQRRRPSPALLYARPGRRGRARAPRVARRRRVALQTVRRAGRRAHQRGRRRL